MKRILLLVIVAISTIQTGKGQCACCAGAGIGSSNNNYNYGILSLPKKTWVLETYFDYRTIQSGLTELDDEKLLKSMSISSLGVRYGITDKITISSILPFVFLHTGFGNDQGVGDLILTGTFDMYSRHNFNLVLMAGIELPTGISKNSNFDNSTVIVGSGSYDPILGISAAKKWNKIMLQASGLYKKTTNGFQGNNYGSLSVQNVSLSYDLTGESRICTVDTSLSPQKQKINIGIFGGYYGEYLEHLKEDNLPDENSGHYVGFANLGTNISVNKWAFPITFSLPILHHLNGNQNNPGYRIRLGILKSF